MRRFFDLTQVGLAFMIRRQRLGKSSRVAEITTSMLLKSCAIPPAIRPSASVLRAQKLHFQRSPIPHIANHCDVLWTVPIFIRLGGNRKIERQLSSIWIDKRS